MWMTDVLHEIKKTRASLVEPCRCEFGIDKACTLLPGIKDL